MSAEPGLSWLPTMVVSFEDGAKQAGHLAIRVNAAHSQVNVHHFPDGESLVTIQPEHAKGRIVALYRSLHNPNEKLIETLLAAAALRDAGALKLILVAPYLPYMRQDCAFQPGQAVSQEVIGELLGRAFEGFITVQPHLHRTASLESVFGGKPALALPAVPAIVKSLKHTASPTTIVVGPDEESLELTREIATQLGLSWTVAKKHRYGDNSVELKLPDDLALAGRPAVIVDDVISTGGTVVALAQSLRAGGVTSIEVFAAHALYDEEDAYRIAAAGIRRVVSLDSTPHVTNGMSVVDIIAKAMGMPE